MEEAGLLYQVISDFCTDKEAIFHLKKISAVDMEVMYLKILFVDFLELYNEEAGYYFTSL